MANAVLKNVYKVYDGKVKAVNDFNLDIRDKEFVVFVGPSGCGKSTTLRMIAGLEEITSGNLYIGDKLVNDVEPKDRDISMVFQNYALYPHMSVYENMAFGLKIKKLPKAEIDRKVREAADILGITEFLDRKPKALSGGQRQRVALGRAIVREPKLFLLDEPLSNLDAKLRVQMRSEIIKLHQRLSATFVYVTHDQTEAMTMGSRIVVMKDGFIQQVDSPSNLYDHPVNDFVATFLGSPQMNLFEAVLEKGEGGLRVVLGGQVELRLPDLKAGQLVSEDYVGKKITLGIRPEDIHESTAGEKDAIAVTAEIVEKLGSETLVYTHIAGRDDYTIASYDARTPVLIDGVSYMRFDMERVHLFDAETGLSLLRVPEVNFLECSVERTEEGDCRLTVGGETFAADELLDRLVAELPEKTVAGVRPDRVTFTPPTSGGLRVKVRVMYVVDYSSYKVVYATLENGGRLVICTEGEVPAKGKKATAYVEPADVDLYDADGERLTAQKEFVRPIEKGSLRKIGRMCSLDAQIKREKKRNAAARIVSMDVFGARTLLTVEEIKGGRRVSFYVDTEDSLYEGMPIYINPVLK